MGTTGQTPGLHLQAGGGGPWPDAACRAALIACGIDPDGFGSYEDRLKAQSAEREAYRDKVDAKVGKGKPHPSPCTYPASPPCKCYASQEAFDECMKEKGGAEKWLRMNSQSGHMSRDEWYRATGSRDDPCANHPPGPAPDGTPTAGGYGYDGRMALCTDHAGLSRGQEHWMICKLEREHAKDVKADPALKGMMPESSLQKQVEATTDRMADDKASGPGGQPVSALGKLSAEEVERGKKIDQARAKMAEEKAASDAKAGAVGPAGGAQAGKPNDLSDAGADGAARDKAKECITDAWKQSLQQMRQKAVDEHGTVAARKQEVLDEHNKKNPPGVAKYEDLPKEGKDEVKRRVAKDMREMEKDPPGLTDRKSTEAKEPPGRPTKDDCRAYQGNWLFLHQDEQGSFPPVQGQAPGATRPSQAAPSDGPPKKKKSV
jgi:hypothetical protein